MTLLSSSGRAEPSRLGPKVYWIGGANGQSAWTCVTRPERVTVELWNDYSVSKPTLMRVVASVRW
jgi:hypothetical protein